MVEALKQYLKKGVVFYIYTTISDDYMYIKTFVSHMFWLQCWR